MKDSISIQVRYEYNTIFESLNNDVVDPDL